MDAEEIGRLIAELENRVERLRALYEQYFMGIERLEPLTVRKDIDRRLWALRREQIRNTGLRFKLETTIQRYNTYQQYWQRIVREIEQGTYQRDLGRAAQRFGDNVVTAFARRRQKMFEKAVTKKAERDARRTGPIARGAPPAEAPPAEVDDGPPSSNEPFDVTFEDSEAAPSTRSPEVSALPPIEPLELDIGIGGPASPRPAPPTAGVAPTTERRGTPPAPTAPREPFVAAARPAPAVPTPASPVNARPAVPAVSPVKPATPFAAAGKPIAPAATPAKGVTPPAPGAKPAAPPAPAARPIAPAVLAAKPAAPATPAARPAPPAAPVARPAGAAMPAAGPAAPATPVTKPAAAAAPFVKPAAPMVTAPQGVAPPHRPAAPSRPDVPAPPVIGEESSLSPIRMRQIYGAFVEAKRRANESTASVTYEKIASNLESVAKELRAKHKARSVDFEVVMKNGKPVLKPVVKG